MGVYEKSDTFIFIKIKYINIIKLNLQKKKFTYSFKTNRVYCNRHKLLNFIVLVNST